MKETLEYNKRFGPGKNVFRRYKKLINATSSLLSILPRSIRISLWHFTNVFPEKMGIGIRYCLLKTLIASCGDNVYIGRYVEIRGWERLTIGTNVSIHTMCYIDATGGISIEDHVSIAHQTSLLSFEHCWDNIDIPIKYNPIVEKPIHISEDVWVGAGARLLAGVHIENRVIIAAGAVVKGHIHTKGIYGGIPAKRIKEI